MKYLLTIYADEKDFVSATPEQIQQTTDAYNAFTQEVKDKGIFLSGEGLEPTSSATTVRVRNGETLTTDGPFAETKEQMNGFYLLECNDLDEAIEWAGKIPGAVQGSVEVRPVLDYDALEAQGTQG
jgi:hypothetical protein